jgi:prolyl-tRNA synthetase
MRFSQYFIPTYKETPAEAESISHQLMLRAGMIRKLAAGIYTYLPVALKSLKKVEAIVREEMNRAGAIELLMPAVQPGELWQESGRWDYYGRELLRFTDRHDRPSCFGPTHEEVITDLMRGEIHSYKQMPVNLYQIQTKFRDEIRPRFGLIRAREFIMKDAYSFDKDEEGTNLSYSRMYEAYMRIFSRCGLRFRAVEADSGPIGGSYSHEFMVLAETGEDEIASCTACSYAANLERAEIKPVDAGSQTAETELEPLREVETPGAHTIDELCRYLSIDPEAIIKTLIFVADGVPVAALVRGDHEMNEIKLKNYLGAGEVELADPAIVAEVTGAPMGFAGPVGLSVRIVADYEVRAMKNIVAGANREDFHVTGLNWGRDFVLNEFADLRVITPDDPCPRCGKPIVFSRGIEVGHVFKLGVKYSKAMKAYFLDEHGKEQPIIMGCYGIGIGRTLAAAIEQNHDEKGIVFPIPLAPFEVTLLALQMHEPRVAETAEQLYRALSDQGLEVLLDDRDERAGVKFNDADLLGIPVRVTVGLKGVEQGYVEIRLRSETQIETVPVDKAAAFVEDKVKNLYDSLK